MESLHTKLRDELKADIRAVQGSISITLDIWSDRTMRGFIGVTGHYLQPSNTLRSVLLACDRFKGEHSPSSSLVCVWCIGLLKLIVKLMVIFFLLAKNFNVYLIINMKPTKQ